MLRASRSQSVHVMQFADLACLTCDSFEQIRVAIESTIEMDRRQGTRVFEDIVDRLSYGIKLPGVEADTKDEFFRYFETLFVCANEMSEFLA